MIENLDDRRLDALLATIADTPADPLLAARIARVARSAPRGRQGLAARLGRWLGFDGPVPWLWQQATGLAAVAAVGFVLGYGAMPVDMAEPSTDDITAVSAAFEPLPFDQESL